MLTLPTVYTICQNRYSMSSEASIKVVLLGTTMVGKTSLVRREMSGLFDIEEAPTIGACFTTKTITLDETTTVKVQIWDTAGQERFRSLAPMYYHNADAAILVYAINDEKTFSDLEGWVEELQRNMNPMPLLWVVGNKSDLEAERQVTCRQADEYAQKIGGEFLETSAKSGQNVSELFETIAGRARKHSEERNNLSVGASNRQNKSCC